MSRGKEPLRWCLSQVINAANITNKGCVVFLRFSLFLAFCVVGMIVIDCGRLDSV